MLGEVPVPWAGGGPCWTSLGTGGSSSTWQCRLFCRRDSDRRGMGGTHYAGYRLSSPNVDSNLREREVVHVTCISTQWVGCIGQ